MAAIAQLGERQTENLKVPGSIPGLGRKEDCGSDWKVVLPKIPDTNPKYAEGTN